MKKIRMFGLALTILALAFVVIYPQQTEAKTTAPSNETYYDAETGQTIKDLYSITENGLVKITFEEFKAHRKLKDKQSSLLTNSSISTTSFSSISPSPQIWSYIYYQSSASQIYKGSYAVSNPFSCAAGAISCTSTVTWSTSESETFTASVTSESIKSAIRVGASFAWNTTASISNSYALTIPPGKTGQIMFDPLLNKTTGTLYTYSDGYLVGTDYPSGYSPVKLQTGMLAGDVWTSVY
jgi:hypothetical protein